MEGDKNLRVPVAEVSGRRECSKGSLREGSEGMKALKVPVIEGSGRRESPEVACG